MGVGQGLPEALVEAQVGEPLVQEAIKAERIGVVLKDEGWAEFRLPVVEDALDAHMLYALENASFALSCPG